MALVSEFLYRLDIVCDSLLHRNERFTSRGILVAAAVEVLAGEEIDVDISARTQADADELAVSQKHGRHLHLLDRQGVVHETLAVPLLELEAAHLVLQQRHVGHRAVLNNLHLAVDGIAEQPGAALGIGVVDAVVNVGDRDALLDQHGHGAEQLRGEEREGEIARVGHHAHVERLGHAACDSPGAAHRLDDAVHQKTRARRIGMREHQVEALVGREVMVDQHAAGRGVGRDGVAEDFEPRNGVEIEAENHVGLRDGAPCAPFGVGLEDHHLVDPGHPVEEIGIFIGHDAGHRMSHRTQDLGPCERRSDGVAVGVGVGDDDDALPGSGEHLPQTFDMFFR